MRKIIFCGSIFAIAIFMTNPAYAYCSEPRLFERVPEAPSSHNRPNVPVCMKDRDRACTDRDVSDYERAVDDYVRKLNDYVRDVVSYGNDVRDHAQEAQKYAECEVRDIQSELR